MSDVPKTFEEAVNVADSDEFYDRLVEGKLLCHYGDPVPPAYWAGILDGRAALMAELLEGVEVSEQETELRGMYGLSYPAGLLFNALDHSRASEAALRKRLASLDDGRVHCPDCHEPVADPCTSWYKDQAALLRKRLAEVGGELDGLRTKIRERRDAMPGHCCCDKDDGCRCSAYDVFVELGSLLAPGKCPSQPTAEARSEWSEEKRRAFEAESEARELREPIDVDALANVIENSRLIGSQYDAERLAERIVEWMEGER